MTAVPVVQLERTFALWSLSWLQTLTSTLIQFTANIFQKPAGEIIWSSFCDSVTPFKFL